MKLTDLEDRVRQVEWPTPSPDLRARVLSETPLVERSISWSDRMWFSRAWRLSLAAATLALLTVQVLSGPRGTTSLAPNPRALAEARVIEETSRQVGLPADVAASLSRRGLAEATGPGARSEQAWTSLGAFAPEGARR